ncbi:MAG: hypothetical protein CVU56_26200 [Deltaproteobacteria bacterium HGW-Deltaproteobacteria-14]|jgi:hypothetical protein|nr:MAG: hypothetical protein CVU56_26200 [Deltaproteobacteria bacterium HGW-Deltaproteobacteria-14]
MRTSPTPTLLIALAVALAAPPAAGAPPDGARRRQGEASGVRERRGAGDAPVPTPSAGDDAPPDGTSPGRARFARRPIEGARGAAAPVTGRELHIAPADAHGCPITGYRRLAERLTALENTSQLMSLEVWGDSHEYAPYQRVIYYLRSPRPVYVTLFWLGPVGDIYVPFSNLKIPANRDVSVDPDSVVVPPLGRERWVAVATLEPLPAPCLRSEPELLGVVAGLAAMPYAIGRWEVRSRPPAEGRPIRPER